MAETPIYKRLPSDTDKSFEAFCIYRDMGANRSLEKVSQALSKSIPLLKGWSTTHNWQERVAAYDASLDEKNLDENAERQKRIKDNAYQDYLKLRKAIDKRMGLLEAVDFRGELYEIVNLAELMKKADDYARRAVGLPDKITEQKNEHTGANGGALTIKVVYDDTMPNGDNGSNSQD